MDGFVPFQRANEAIVLLNEGEFGRALDQIASVRAECRAYDSPFYDVQLGFGVATIYARMATGEGQASGGKLGIMMRNPGFVLKHARRASQTAHDAFKRLSDELPPDLEGFRFLIEYEFAKLLVKRKEFAEARARLERAIAFLRPMGDCQGMRDSRALLAAIDGK
jgi:hypothetical protein